jgi:hypothetical protein
MRYSLRIQKDVDIGGLDFSAHRQIWDASLRRSKQQAPFPTDAARRQAGLCDDCRVLLAALWLAGSQARPTTPPSTVSRASLRRAVPSFTVEVRRRPRLATNPSQELQSPETRTRPAAFESESHRLAAAAFGAADMPNQPSNDGGASSPKRRILESLVPEKPAVAQLEDELLSAAKSNPKSRARSSGASTATANRVVGNSGGPAPCQKAKRRVQIPIVLDASSVPVSAEDPRSITRTDSLGAVPTAVADVSRPNRKRTIMGRYVFGDEFKPGERWKWRLSKGR